MLSTVHECISISDFNLSDAPFMLAMGNETRGISGSWDEYDPKKLTLPPLGNAESLNVAMAASAILSKLLY